MKLRERVGLNIQNLRRSKELSQEELAHIANIDRSYMSSIELAKSSTTIDKLEQLADALNVDASAFFHARFSPSHNNLEE
ncbi:MAG: helix-turn-helix domain-containing protein [Pelagimonas sp.]|uniref:helix-turn-helix domain-containing protein n=1 Tax=Pelagimonas sp. TaxID=2073170 RepID=UPI003D6BF6BA